MIEGQVINSAMYRRIYKENKHWVQINVGSPGSGKSYQQLRQAEIWYNRTLKKKFPLENICFTTESVMGRLNYYADLASKGINVKGEIIIYEEAGVSQGSLDFQTSMAKIFNYVMQSFRSMNLILLMNLPYFTMLNKNTRMLATFRMDSVRIDKQLKQSIWKPYYLHSMQQDGAIWTIFPKVLSNGFYESVEEVGYYLPSDELKVPYEKKKAEFLKGLIGGSLISMEHKDKKRLTALQMQIYNLMKEGIVNSGEIARKLGVNQSRISHNLNYMTSKGYDIQGFVASGGFEANSPPPKSILVGEAEKSEKLKELEVEK